MRAQHSHQLARIALERGSPAHALPFAIGAVVAGGLWSLAFRAWTSAAFHRGACTVRQGARGR